MTQNQFNEVEDFWDTMPESKLELIDGKLIVGNSLTASQLLVRKILEEWGATVVLSLVEKKLAWKALKEAYPDAPIFPDRVEYSQIQTWASQQVNYQPEDLSAGGQGKDCGHGAMRSRLHFEMWQVVKIRQCGRTLGRDFVIHIGDNGFTPDVSLFCGKSLNCLSERYAEGPADLVIEVILPAHAAQDREVKRYYYEAGGVQEYWIVDPQQQQIELLRLVNGRYQPQQPDTEGRYHPHNIPNLAFLPAKLWQSKRAQKQLSLFEVGIPPKDLKIVANQNDLKQEKIPFAPRIALASVSISFQEYMSWCPPAKITGCENKLEEQNIHYLLGLLLMTLGMVETIKLLHPQQWVSALIEA